MKTATATLSKFAAVLALGCLSAAPALAQPSHSAAPASRIAWLSSERIYNESKLAKRAGDKLAQEFSTREKTLQDMAKRLTETNALLEKDGRTMQDPERVKKQKEAFELDREFQRRQREFREDLNQRTNEERAAIADKATNIIKRLAQTEGFDIVLQDAVWASPRIDITNKVLEALDSDKPQ